MRTVGPHFLVPPEAVSDGRVVLTGEDAHHLAVVLRARPGDPVSVADGRGALLQTRVVGTGREVLLRTVEAVQVPAPRPRLTVVHALPKGRKLDEVVQRLSEIGVDRLVPVHSERSQVQLSGERAAKALRRWRAVALAAAKQSRRARVLQVEEIGRWQDAVAAGATGLVLWEQAHVPLRTRLAELLHAAPDLPEELILAVGPEGGLSAEEAHAGGLAAAGLGATILRTETAALVAATLVLGALGRLG